MNEKLTSPPPPLPPPPTSTLGSTEESIVNQNRFKVLSILYVTNFCETRKTNSIVIRALFLLLNLGALRIIFK